MKIISGNFGEQRSTFEGVSSLAGVRWRAADPRLWPANRRSSRPPFELQGMPIGSTIKGLSNGEENRHRRCTVAGEDDRRVACTRWPSRATSRPRRVQARGGAWEVGKFGKNPGKSGKLFYGGSCHQFVIWPSRCLGFRTDQPRFA